MIDPRPRPPFRLTHNPTLAGAGRVVMMLCAVALLAVGPVQAQDQDQEPPPAEKSEAPDTPTSTHPFADPVVETHAAFAGRKATAWGSGDRRWLLLEQDARVTIGAYAYRVKRALVRIDIEKHPGKPIRHLSVRMLEPRAIPAPGEKSAAVRVEARTLLVTVSTTGGVTVKTDLLDTPEAFPDDDWARAQARAIRRYWQKRLTQPIDREAVGPTFTAQQRERRAATEARLERQRLTRTGAADPATLDALARINPADRSPPTIDGPDPQDPDAAASPLTPPDDLTSPAGPPGIPSNQRTVVPVSGTVSFYAERLVLQEATDAEPDPYLMAIGKVRVGYQRADGSSGIVLAAERAIIFFDPERFAGLNADSGASADAVRGVYLEDNVRVTDGDFTVRAPRVYYDLATNKAVLLEAVLYAYDVSRQLPLYLRADTLRQESLKSWTAHNAKLTTSDFAIPHFAIGAERLTLKQFASNEGKRGLTYEAENVSAQLGGAPVAVWPGFAGKTADSPLRDVSVGFDSNDGPILETSWDLFNLQGREAPEGIDWLARLDWLGDHQLGLGTELSYDLPDMDGLFRAYLVPDDEGEDDIGNRLAVPQNDDTRGAVLWQHKQRFREFWELNLELGYVSDETFLEEYFPQDALEGKPTETLIYLKRQENETAFTFLAEYDLIDFLPQTTTLQAPGYSVEKAPEFGYYRLGTSLFDDRVTWFTENRLGRVRIRSGEDSPAERGFTAAQSSNLFGIAPGTTFAARDAANGIPNDHRLRFDSRHEFNAPVRLAEVLDVTPFVAGRLTAYDDDFAGFSGDDDNARLWGSVGVRTRTQLVNTYDGVNSRVLDLRRLRHIIEPMVDFSLAASTIDSSRLPVFDPQVEALSEGFTTRVGVRNTLQTQRGGPGRWRSVDWLVIDTEAVFRSDDTDTQTFINRFFSYRPEFALGGDHFHGRVLWMVSDTLAAVADVTYNMERDNAVQYRTGISIDHSPRLTSYIEYDVIDVIPSELIHAGFTYELTTKYTLGVDQTFDVELDRFRSLQVSLERDLPGWTMRALINADDIDDRTTVGFVLEPKGLDQGFGAQRTLFTRQ